MLDKGTEGQISMVVIDEIHLLADPTRGFLLELFLTKIKYCINNKAIQETGSPAVQIVGMSATLPNIKDLATWIDASLYVTTYRPGMTQY